MVIEGFEEYYKNHTTDETAKFYGVSNSTVIRTAKKLGCSKPVVHGYKKGSKPTISSSLPKEIKNEIIYKFKNGEMVNFLAKKFNLSWKQVAETLREVGIENPAKKVNELSGEIRKKFLEERRNKHYLKTGSYKFDLSDEHKKKISDTRRRPGNRERLHQTYSEAQKKLVASGFRPFGEKHGLRQSKVNNRVYQLFKEKGVELEREKKVGNYFYDFAYGHFLIEINPTITHNVTRDFSETVTGRKQPKKKIYRKYHYDRWKNAQENGYELLSLFGWRDLNSFIDFFSKRAKGFENRVFARKTEVREVDKKLANQFFKENHLLGETRGAIVNYGLYYKNQLLEIMSFGRPRNTRRAEYELLRLASLGSWQVVGGASKLFNHFIKNYSPKSVITYADNNLGSSRVYTQIGFKLISDSSISATWNKPETRRKSKVLQGCGIVVKESSLLKLGADRFFKNTPGYFKVGLDYDDFILRGGKEEYSEEYKIHTEEGWWPGNSDIMEHQGFFKVYDCGYSTYLYIENSGCQ